MGKPSVRVIRVRKWATLVLLVLVSVAMVSLIYSLSGRAYSRGEVPAFGEVRQVAGRLSHGSYSLPELLAIAAPPIINMLIFVPWGTLMFLLVARPDRSAVTGTLVTWLAGMSFALLLQLWQRYLPMKVTDINDCLWNGLGALAGAMAGQLRRRLHLRFE